MAVRVRFYEDVREFAAVAMEFLRSRAVLHNLILTLLDARLMRAEPGRYWLAWSGETVAGAVFQSPLLNAALVVPMEAEVIEALVDVMVESDVMLPGVNGDAATAARFAGCWTERRRTGATPKQGLRLYELDQLKEMRAVDGKLRTFAEADRELTVEWVRAFNDEVREPPVDPLWQMDGWLSTGRIWLWEYGGAAVSMAVSRKPMEGVVRLTNVFTPPEMRGRGYAGACVYGVSEHFYKAGVRCILYTDLDNATSNSIYRKIGYRVVSEGIHYQFNE